MGESIKPSKKKQHQYYGGGKPSKKSLNLMGESNQQGTLAELLWDFVG
jgi:hypothetical protein